MNVNLIAPVLPAVPLHLLQSFAMSDSPLAAASVEAGQFESAALVGFYL